MNDVRWTMLDGHTMTGQVIFRGYHNSLVRRVDGTVVSVSNDMLDRATLEDVQAAIGFYQKTS